MARPGFQKHPKFRRLVHLLKEPVPHVLGYVECMWEVAYENGNPFLGEALDVELAAQWPGEPGKLARALAACGLIDPLEKGDDHLALIPSAVERVTYSVHDLFDHAPDYVFDRSKRELERKKEKICCYCGETYRSRDRRSRFCTDACRQANHRNGLLRNVTDSHGALHSVTQRNGTPAPAPAPAHDSSIHPPNPLPDSVTAGWVDGVSWGEVMGRLAKLGVVNARQAVVEARDGCGSSPELAMQLLDYAEAHGKGPGAIVWRFKRAVPTMPLDVGWPMNGDDPQQAILRADKAAEKKRLAEDELLATKIIQAGRRRNKSDEEIRSDLKSKNLEWPK